MCFISHKTREDEAGLKFARALRADLSAHGVESLHSDDFNHHEPLLTDIRKAVRKAHTFVAILSPGYSESRFCQAELEEAVRDGKPLFAVKEVPVDEDQIPQELRELFFYDFTTVPNYKDGVEPLARGIIAVCPPITEMKRRLLAPSFTLLIAVALALVMILGLLLLNRKPQTFATTGVQSPADHSTVSPARGGEIISPVDGSQVPFSLGDGQGGRVEIRGRSGGLAASDAILLTMTASDGNERPQLGGPEIRTDASGAWMKPVQVGNLNFPPKRGDRYTVRIYVISKNDFDSFKAHNISVWPPENNPSLKAQAESTFTLVE